MKTLKMILLCASLLGFNSAMAQNLSAVHVKEDLSKVSLSSPFWQKAKAERVEVYPQTTIEMNDEELIKANEANLAKVLQVKTLSDGKSIAFLLHGKILPKAFKRVIVQQPMVMVLRCNFQRLMTNSLISVWEVREERLSCICKKQRVRSMSPIIEAMYTIKSIALIKMLLQKS